MTEAMSMIAEREPLPAAGSRGSGRLQNDASSSNNESSYRKKSSISNSQTGVDLHSLSSFVLSVEYSQ